MRIGIQAADLDHDRIDGTRVYIWNLLNQFGAIDSTDDFFIYHKRRFNPELEPKTFANYKLKKIRWPFFWTQTRFAGEIWRDRISALWVPFHNVPLMRRQGMRTTITIHDLAFKIFPQYFPTLDLFKINLLTDLAVRHADKIIAISEATKRDILRFYPRVKEDSIRVIHHGFDRSFFEQDITPGKAEKFLTDNGLKGQKYLLYVGAIQPRKNLKILVQAFNLVKKDHPETKLVVAGGKAWLWQEIMDEVERSPYRKDIVMPGQISREELVILYKHAEIFVFPSLYEGFGIPALEAMAAGTPALLSRSSSLPEVAGPAAEYVDDYENPTALAQGINKLLGDEKRRQELRRLGLERIKEFSWEKCARETLAFIKE